MNPAPPIAPPIIAPPPAPFNWPRFEALTRLAIWSVVAIWCLAPIMGFCCTSFLGIFQGRGGNGGAPVDVGGGGFGPGAMVLLGGTMIFAAFTYGVWCAVGVIMGFGMDRALFAVGVVVTKGRGTP